MTGGRDRKEISEGTPRPWPPGPSPERIRARRRQFLNHLVVFFFVMVVIVPLNVVLTPHEPWFLLILVGWGAPLAVHAAWAMNLFGGTARPPDNGHT